MVVTSSPIYDDIRDLSQEDVGSVNAPPGRQLAEMVEPLKSWTVEALVDLEKRL